MAVKVADSIGALLTVLLLLASWLMVRATRFSGRPPSAYDVDSTAHDVDPRHLHG